MSKLTVTFLGSGDAFGSGGRLQACIHVETPSGSFLLDCGASSMSAMKARGVSPSSIHAILLTHLHGDHFGGVPYFLLDARLVARRDRPLTIMGPPGTESRIRDAMEALFPGSSEVPPGFSVKYVEWADRNPVRVGDFVVTPYQVVHGSGAPPFALRLERSDKVLAYSGDTEWVDALMEAAAEADLFLCEAYTFEKKMKFHLDYRTLMERRAALQCKRLVLTHMSEDLLRHLPDIDAEWAEDGKCILL